MIKTKIRKIMAMSLMTISLLTTAITPAMARDGKWMQDRTGWWYSTGSKSWAVGWKEIDGKWYYFDNNGYMVHDTTTMGWTFNSNGNPTYDVNKNCYWGRNIKSMNFQSNGSSAEYEYSYEEDGKKVKDNLNNEYTNYLTLKVNASPWTDDYAYIEFPLNGEYTKFKCKLGIAQEYQNVMVEGIVKIYLDDKVAYETTLNAGDMLKDIDLNLTGKNKIKFYFEQTAEDFKEQYAGSRNEKIGFFNGEFKK